MNSLLLDEYFVFFYSAILKNNILLRFSGSKSTVDVRCRCCVQWKWWAARGNSHHYINCWIYRTCWQVNNNNTHISTHLFLLSLGYDTIFNFKNRLCTARGEFHLAKHFQCNFKYLLLAEHLKIQTQSLQRNWGEPLGNHHENGGIVAPIPWYKRHFNIQALKL